MSIRIEALPQIWDQLGAHHGRVLLFLAKRTDWNSKGLGPKEIATGSGVDGKHVPGVLAHLVSLSLIHKEEEKPRYVAGRAVVSVREKDGWVDHVSLKDALADIGVIRPDATEDVDLRLRVDLPRATAVQIAASFPGYEWNDRVSGRTRISEYDLGNALDYALPDLLQLPGAMEVLQRAKERIEDEREASHQEELREQAAINEWQAANPGKSWISLVGRPAEEERKAEAEHRKAALFRATLDAEAHLEADPTRWI